MAGEIKYYPKDYLDQSITSLVDDSIITNTDSISDDFTYTSSGYFKSSMGMGSIFGGGNVKDADITFAATNTFGSKTYYLAQIEVAQAAISTDKNCGTLTLAIDGTEFAAWDPNTEYFEGGSRQAHVTKTKVDFYNTPLVDATNDRTITLTLSGNSVSGAYAFIDDLKFNLYYGFKALYNSPSTGGSSSGSFSGNATSDIVDKIDGSVTKSLVFTTKDGYKLTGWNVNGVEDVSLKSTISKTGNHTTSTITVKLDGSTVYQPIVERVSYKIILAANPPGTGTEGSIYKNAVNQNKKTHEVSYNINTSSTDLDFSTYTAEKNFYTFAGWKYEHGDSTSTALKLKASDLIDGTGSGGTATENTRIYYAQYTPKSYTYSINGRVYAGSVENFQNSASNRATFPERSQIIDRIGYTFQYIEDKDTLIHYNPGDEVPLSESYKTFEVVFTQNSYTIDFKAEGGAWLHGENKISPVLMDDSRGAISLKLPSKPGYYTYWEIQRTVGQNTYTTILTPEETKTHTVEINSTNELIGDRVYIAHYNLISYDVKYSAKSDSSSGGDGRALILNSTPGSPTSTITDRKSLNQMSIPGYEFLGWVSKESTNKIPNKENPKIEITPVNDPYTEQLHPQTGNPYREYIAYFRPIVYNIDFDYSSPAKENGSAPITPKKAPANKATFPTMTVETQFTRSLVPPEAEGYDFSYWEIWVGDKEKNKYNLIADHVGDPLTPIVLNTNTALGDYKYVAIYEPKIYQINYSVLGIHESYLNNFQLRSTYGTNKDRDLSLQEDINNTPIVVERPGYRFEGFRVKNSLSDPVINFTLNAHENTSDLQIELVFSQHNITIKATPKLRYPYRSAELLDDFPEFNDLDEDGKEIKNKGVPWIDFKRSKTDIAAEKNEIEIDYLDGITVYRKLNFNDKIYKFVGWDHLSDGENEPYIQGQLDLDLEVIPTINNDPRANEYYAIFEYKNYDITVTPYCMSPDLIEDRIPGVQYGEGECGALFIHKKDTDAEFTPSSFDNIVGQSNINIFNNVGITPAKNSIQYLNGKYTITNLHYHDKIELAMIPYSIPHSVNNINKRYHFSHWDAMRPDTTSDTLLQITVGDSSWQGQFTRALSPRFSVIDFANTVKKIGQDPVTGENISNDFAILEQLFKQTIDGFILVNSINNLGSYGFYNCSNLEYAFLPGVNRIGNHAFDGCSKLKTTILSSTAQGSTGLDSFKNCTNLNLIILPSGLVALNNIFKPEDREDSKSKLWSLLQKQLGRIYVPESSLAAYLTDTNWCQYGSIIRPLPTNLADSIIYNEPVLLSDSE